MILAQNLGADEPEQAMEPLQGEWALAIEGSFNGTQVDIFFKDANDETPLEQSADWSFTDFPDFPQRFGFPYGVVPYIKTTGGTVDTDITLRAYKYDANA